MSVLDTIGSLILGSSSGYFTPESGTKVIPNIVISEDHVDQTEYTLQPIEYGAAVTDHSFQVPPRLRMQYGWSNASIEAISADFTNSLDLSASMSNFGEGYVRKVYAKLLSIQQSRSLCTVVTMKRTYENMLIGELRTRTDSTTAYSMVIDFEMVQIIRVTTRSFATASTQNSGSKTLTAVATPSLSG